jgi:hypothetical protein
MRPITRETTFQVVESNDSTVSIHNWKQIENFGGTLGENGVTMTNVRGDYTTMRDYFFGRTQVPTNEREIGTCVGPKQNNHSLNFRPVHP